MSCKSPLSHCSKFGASPHFVTLSHNILTDKLMKYGLDKWEVSWIKNWLNGWAQRVIISGTNYTQKSVISGVSQA